MIENETLKVLKSRRRCRAFKKQEVSQEILKAVLEAGTYAPNGWDKQSASIVAIRDEATRKVLKELSYQLALEAGEEGEDQFYGAPVLVLILADKASDTALEDGSLVAGNIMNAAESLGLGTCWVHTARKIMEMPEGKAMLQKWGVEGEVLGVTFLALGWPAEKPQPPRARKENYIRYI